MLFRSIRAELERVDSKFQEYKEMYSKQKSSEKATYTMEDSIALDNNIAAAFDEASARMIVQGIDKTTLGKANSAKVSRDDINGNLRVDLYYNGNFMRTAEVKLANPEANSIAAGETVEIDLYQQSN